MTMPFFDRPVSRIAEHPAGCCAAAQRWLVAVGAGHGASAAWVAEHIEWAPTTWPIHWCDLLAQPSGDCGVQAAVAEHVLRATGETVRRAQMVLRYGSEELAQWRGMWDRSASTTRWIADGLCYHEAVAIGDRGVRVVDATEPIKWTASTDGLVALRLDGPTSPVHWEDSVLTVGQWHLPSEARSTSPAAA